MLSSFHCSFPIFIRGTLSTSGSWTKIYQQLNAAQIGFDVIHPQLSLTITDAAQLSAFASGAGLRFSIPVADLPSGMS